MKFIERLSRKSAQQPQPADPGQAPLLMALEPRIMFDASVGVVAQDAAAQTTADAAKDSTSDNDSSQAPAAAGATASQQQGSQRHEVVFIDGQVSNVEQLQSGDRENPTLTNGVGHRFVQARPCCERRVVDVGIEIVAVRALARNARDDVMGAIF